MIWIGRVKAALAGDKPKDQVEGFILDALSCGNIVSTGMVFLFMKESFPVCSGRGEVLC